MGIDNVDAAALIVGGAIILGAFFEEGQKLTMNITTALLVLGLAMLGFGLADIIIDSV